ncbi:MAG TPA: hypothetical protein VMB47_17790 [Candidatus Aquilonibacter sp.]|nr:hypothetical protein [Candidatus Aquilonibacter sp.]
MDSTLKSEVAEAGLRLLRVVARVVNESPECFAQRKEKWSFEFRNPATGEGIVVTYAGPSIPSAVN